MVTLWDIIWYDENSIDPNWKNVISKDAYYSGIESASFRNSYESENMYYAAICGGKNGETHGQLDKGSFVYEANGVRWAIDLGLEKYSLKNYWIYEDSQFSRWNYYRSRAEGHNTLVIDSGYYADQAVDGEAKMIQYVSRDNDGFAIMDLSDVYNQWADRVFRGIHINKEPEFLSVQDEIELKKSE